MRLVLQLDKVGFKWLYFPQVNVY